ncbi:guanine nucleotide exchange protein for ADP-robosylation factor [Geranomyces michiganensis]|nr:guanine nucleotide exchange protein for ADP-robosylation factor [Geranomyces michiganensis]
MFNNLFGNKDKDRDKEHAAAKTIAEPGHPVVTASSRISTSTPAPGGAQPQGSSDVFIKLALEQMQAAKESKKLSGLKDASKSAMEALEAHSAMDSQSIQTVFAPFQMACRSRQPVLATIAIDCLGKLFTYNYWGRHEVLLEGDSAVGGTVADFDMEPPRKDGGAPRISGDDDRSSMESEGDGGGGMVAFVVDTICDTFGGGENTDEKVQLQIVKALLAAVSTTDPQAAVHGGVLLKAVRTTYNIFLLSKSASTQIVAQATLTQMVQAVFGRVPPTPKIVEPPSRPSTPGADAKANAISPASSDATVKSPTDDTVPGTAEELVGGAEVSIDDERPSSVNSSPMKGTRSIDSLSYDGDTAGVAAALRDLSRSAAVRASQDILNEATKKVKGSATDQYLKDAYLVFRALCKLSMKPIPAPEGATDLKSHAMRSKLLSLHLVFTILSSHMYIFFVPAPVLFSAGTSSKTDPNAVLFVHAVKQYLCLSLSRNAVSVVPQVFDVSLEIFGMVLVGLRSVLKKELSVIFTEIVIPIVEARSSITFHQRTSLLRSLERILADPKADGGRVLVEIYLNYDCDVEAGARENIWERLINALAKVMTQHYEASVPNAAAQQSQQQSQPRGSGGPPAITTANLTSFTKEQVRELYSSTGDYQELKKRGLELMVRGVLRPLVQWCNERAATPPTQDDDKATRKSEEVDTSTKLGLIIDEEGKKQAPAPKRIADDPTAFETLRQRKQVLSEGIKQFNFKPKKGMQYLLDSGCIPARTPQDIARFLLNNDGLNKSMIGEFLGEGEEENIAIMHAFVDEMDFTALTFVDALRHFLQCFRLPGEAQKIDRFMLKFAERYVKGNPQTFSSADTAYVLAYSTIMLNTDQHNAQVKNRMTKADFKKNNRGIDEGKDVAPEFLEAIYDEINQNEIVMKDEQPLVTGVSPGGPNSQTGVGGNRKEVAQFALASETMALKTEALFNTMLKGKTGKRNTVVANSSKDTGSGGAFYIASHFEHVKGMFQIIWMSILTGISGPLQESEDVETIIIVLEGFKHATRIACLFDMELEKNAFISTLSKFTMLGNIHEMRAKNFEATKTLLEIAFTEGNHLGGNWKDVVLCISQLEKLQVVGGDDPNKPRSSTDKLQRRESSQAIGKTGFLHEAAAEASSQEMTIVVDRIFTSSTKLSGSAIVAFVRALCEVSWDEITFSSDREHPRMYCLQRLVEMSYYNMKRIRVEWSNIWAILGDHFNQVGCHPNSNVGYFALDKLRQLAMKFLELEELPNFKFQKDFLRPFEHVLGNNSDVKIKDMVLACLQQMIQAKDKSIKSGWKAMFGAFMRAARETHEPIVLLSFDIVKSIFKTHFESVVANQTFPDAVSCLVEFCKNRTFARTSLQSVEILRQSIPRIYDLSKTQQGSKLLSNATNVGVLRSSENLTESVHQSLLAATPTSAATPGPMGTAAKGLGLTGGTAPEDDPSFRFWFPVLFGLYEVIMTCDLEVRTRALNYLFDTLKQYGAAFSRDFWEVISKGVLFPIFDDLRLSRQEHTKFANKEDMSVWLSTTLIQALRQFIDLFGHYFDTLNFQIDGVLELLTVCMTQENETLARIGSTCLQQFIEGNVSKLDEEVWGKICSMFVHLFEVTTPHALFFDPNDNGEAPPSTPAASDPSAGMTSSTPANGENAALVIETRPRRPRPQKKEFQQIIVKCVLHLLIIQTLHEVLTSGPEDVVYHSLNSRNLFTLIDCLERSYRFAREFNGDMELRMALYRMGFMKQLPNLLKQETSSVSSYLNSLIKMYLDGSDERKAMRPEIEKRLVPLCHDIMQHYNSLDPESKRRNVNAWRPVVVTILNALAEFDEEQFRTQMPLFYGEVVNLLAQDVTPDVRLVLHALLIRTGTTFGILSEREAASATASRTSLTGPEPLLRHNTSSAFEHFTDPGDEVANRTNGGDNPESGPIEAILPDLSLPEAPMDMSDGDGTVQSSTGEGGWMISNDELGQKHGATSTPVAPTPSTTGNEPTGEAASAVVGGHSAEPQIPTGQHTGEPTAGESTAKGLDENESFT